MNAADIMILVFGIVSGVALFFGIRYHVKNRKEDCSSVNAISVIYFLLFPGLVFAFSVEYLMIQFVEPKADITMITLVVWLLLASLSLILIPIVSILRCKTVAKAKLISWARASGSRVRRGPARYRAVFEYEFDGKRYRCETNTPLLSKETAEFKVKEEYDIYISEKLPTLCRPWRKLMQYEIYGMVCGAVMLGYCVYLYTTL